LLILPAFGAFAGGLNAREPAIADLLSGDFQAYMIGRKGLFGFQKNQLIADPQRTPRRT
jgi:hypothetical protein